MSIKFKVVYRDSATGAEETIAEGLDWQSGVDKKAAAADSGKYDQTKGGLSLIKDRDFGRPKPAAKAPVKAEKSSKKENYTDEAAE